jgi:nitroreductase
MSQIIEAMNWRYSVRNFDTTKIVSPEKVEILKESFRLTATSFGLQPLKLVIIKNKELQQTLVPSSYNQKQVGTASHLLLIAIEKDYAATIVDAYFDLEIAVRGTKPEVIAPFKAYLKNNFSQKTANEKRQFALNQAYIALGNLMTTCALEQIDACPMEGFEPKKYDEILGLSAKNLEAVLLLPIGYRMADDKSSRIKKVRKSLDDLILEL